MVHYNLHALKCEEVPVLAVSERCDKLKAALAILIKFR